MKETKKNVNNNIHLYGYINSVSMKESEVEVKLPDGTSEKKTRTAINLNVSTLEQYQKDGKFVNDRTFHDVVLFTFDPETVKAFQEVDKKIQSKEEKKREQTISLSGTMVNKKGSNEIRIIAKEDSIDLNVEQADKEVRNRAELVGNIGSVKLYEDKNFATVSLIHHFRPEDAEKELETTLQVRIDGDRKHSKDTYEALKNGELGVGDFVKVGGQLHNNNYMKDEKKVYSTALDLTSAELLHKKGEKKAESAEVKEEAKPAKKAAAKKAEAPAKKAETKKAVSRKKGVKM